MKAYLLDPTNSINISKTKNNNNNHNREERNLEPSTTSKHEVYNFYLKSIGNQLTMEAVRDDNHIPQGLLNILYK